MNNPFKPYRWKPIYFCVPFGLLLASVSWAGTPLPRPPYIEKVCQHRSSLQLQLVKRSRQRGPVEKRATSEGHISLTGPGLFGHVRVSPISVGTNLTAQRGVTTKVANFEYLPQGSEGSLPRYVLRTMTRRGARQRTSEADFALLPDRTYKLATGQEVTTKGGFLLGVKRRRGGALMEKFFLDDGQGRRIAIPWAEYNGKLFHTIIR